RSRIVGSDVRALAAAGALTPWRDELYGVRERFDDAPAFLVERAAARFLGIRTYAAHGNGLAGPRRAPLMWLARRSPTKAIDQAMRDNLVGGGISYGSSVRDTLVREAWEEAGVPESLATQASLAG